MRKIKFRGKRLNNGEWAYGAFVPTNLNRRNVVTWGLSDLAQSDGRKRWNDWSRQKYRDVYRIKDKNGTEIWRRYC